MGTLGVQGTVDLDAAAKPTVNLEICHEGDCFTETVVFGEEDQATCTKGEFDCTLSEASAGEWRLVVELRQGGAEFEEGTKVTVLVEDATTGEALVDETLTIEEAEENQLCGSSCHSADVSWDK